MTTSFGAAGRLAAAFINSKLTPLVILASMGLGGMAIVALPREEEPQIVVPMVDVFVGMPGATPEDVEQRVTRPMERLLWEVPGVEYVYSTSSPGQSLVIVRFRVGESEEAALVHLNQKLASHMDLVPPGATPPLVKPRSIDDVPILAVTLSSSRYGDDQLRVLAAQLRDAIAEVPDVSEVTLIGGRPRQVGVTIDTARLAAQGLDPLAVQQALVGANAVRAAGGPVAGGTATGIDTGARLTSADDVARVVVASRGGRPVHVGDVAQVTDGDAEPTSYVRFQARGGGIEPAVTISVAKRKGTNAIDVSHRVTAKLDTLKGTLVPADVTVTLTRDYGETAAEKSNELLWHMLLAVLSVSALIWITLGRREAAVVLTAIPVTLALTLFMFFLYGYTLNRITLFALIFSIGILVDDAIVVVENIVRHARMRGASARGLVQTALVAVDEVGNPTILATMAVVAAILPMAFVGGLMGPYMRPIPVGASAAMVFSLIVAFIVTPWAAVRILKPEGHHDHGDEDLFTRLYRRVMGPLLSSTRMRLLFLGGVALLLLAAAALVPLQLVTVKMLPFDNKSEFQVVIDLPEGTALEETARVTALLGTAVLEDPDVVNVQQYVGTAAPYNFNGLVRHYFLRQSPHLADLQVNLVPKDERAEQSHDVARRVRDRLVPLARASGAAIQVAEVPPGPPVLQTMVAEIYGPVASRRQAIAADVKALFERTPGVVDTDWYVEAGQPKSTLTVDGEKAMAAGLAPADVAAVVQMAGDGAVAGLLQVSDAREDVAIVLRLPRDARDLDAVRAVRLHGAAAEAVAVGELTRLAETRADTSLYHKNLQPVTYVTADLAGENESPVYAILRMNETLDAMQLPEGYGLEVFNAEQPFDTAKYAMKWDGEWHITIEVFRDLGLAFAVVLVLIYVLVVGWFQSFTTPLLIMAAIPFSLVGILPAHAAMGAFFTATSMIGFIAGAGIVVRNSIILVDFIELRLRDGLPLEQAVVDAGAVRFRPMALTAAAVIVGAGVILFDPIFQGLAISLMAGEVASLLLSRMAVPVLYFMAKRHEHQAAAPEAIPAEVIS
ncbi:MAG TPA: efflux RND transporter permease subunit [Vicinamibacterales bacterium]|nr:efflux RND transporter permease subunit [Vicinamibacterales bacterium]